MTTPRHPGFMLADELKNRKITQRDFCQRVGMGYAQFNEILKGKRPISPTLALQLDWFFIGTAEQWTSAQAQYELELAKENFQPPART